MPGCQGSVGHTGLIQSTAALPHTSQPAAAVTPQVRAEERSAAKAALSQAISRTKQQLGAKYGQGLLEVQQTDTEPQTELQ